tara:strand:- start:1279 stop:2544 length:1266 start_codon:yes stop_codon:yes gene_type:complete
MKILNPILHAKTDKFERIANISRKTWMSNKHKDIFSFFYTGGSQKTYIDNDILHLDCEDTWIPGDLTINRVSTIKMIKMLEFCFNNYDFDFIFRTSNSTFVNYVNLFNCIDEISTKEFYGGLLTDSGKKFHSNNEDISYALGHAVILDKKFIELILNNKNRLLEYNMIDDIALGKFALESNIKPIHIPLYAKFAISRCKPEHIKSESEHISFVENCFESLNAEKEKNVIQKEKDHIYIHIPKTAGSSAYIQNFSYHGHNSRNPNYIYYKDSNKRKLSKFSYAFVRNPWDRLVSAFFYLKGGGNWLPDEEDYEKYLAKYSNFTDMLLNWDDDILNQCHIKEQYKWICDDEENIIVDFVGRFENLQEDFNVVCDKTGIPRNQLPHTNKTKHKSYTEYYDDETKQIVAEKYAKDIEYFGYKFGQ